MDLTFCSILLEYTSCLSLPFLLLVSLLCTPVLHAPHTTCISTFVVDSSYCFSGNSASIQRTKNQKNKNAIETTYRFSLCTYGVMRPLSRVQPPEMPLRFRIVPLWFRACAQPSLCKAALPETASMSTRLFVSEFAKHELLCKGLI